MKPIAQRRHAEHEFVLAGEERGVVLAQRGRQAIFLQVVRHDLAPPQAVGEQQHAPGVALQEVLRTPASGFRRGG